MDIFTPEHRSAMMARIRSRDAKPEIVVQRLVWKLGYRYRLHDRQLPGCPDIVLPRHRKIIFVHGCFWHSHPGCKRATIPKTRRKFWTSKFKENVNRHRKNGMALRKLGWKLLVIWECELRTPHRVLAKLSRFMEPPSYSIPRLN